MMRRADTNTSTNNASDVSSSEDELSVSVSSSSASNSNNNNDYHSDSDDGYASYGGGGSVGGVVAVRRRAAPTSGNYTNNSSHNSTNNRSFSDVEDNTPSKRRFHNSKDRSHRHKSHHHRHWSSALTPCRFLRTIRRNRRFLTKHFPTLFLISCFVFWLLVQTGNVYDSVKQQIHHQNDQRPHNQHPHRAGGYQEFKKNQLLKRRPTAPPENLASRTGAFFSDAVDGFMDLVGLPGRVFRQVSRGEALLPGCVRADWQEATYINCNDLHETNLYSVLTQKYSPGKKRGFVGSGYWRHVWLVDPRQEFTNSQTQQNTGNGAVLKMMKSEHKVETRNFERHRRDALAMERLSSAPNIVDIYAYCGNSVLTEYVGSDLHQVLYHSVDNGNDDDENQEEKEEAPPPQSQSQQSPQRTEREALELALGVIQGVAALHQVPGGPIVHADIADKQFLFDKQRQIVKLNDFNRCRFMGYKKGHPEQTCSFRIPSAPGRHRSPEEYKDDELTEQLDTYSTANVLYGILTGTPPWQEYPSSQVKKAVKHGLKPPIPDEVRKSNVVLAKLVDEAFEGDPNKRITAPAMVAELEKALAAMSSPSQPGKKEHVDSDEPKEEEEEETQQQQGDKEETDNETEG